MKNCNTCRKFKKHAWCVKCEYEPKDLVDVVRCKECKWFNNIGCAIKIVDDSDKPKDNDYCSFGERADKKRQPPADVRDDATAHKVVGGGERDGTTCWFECDNCGLAVDIGDVFCKHCGARFVP